MQGKNVGVCENGGDLDLAQEAIASDRFRQGGAQDLQRDLAPVSRVLREVDGGHSTAPDLSHDPIPRSQRGPKLLEFLLEIIHEVRLRPVARHSLRRRVLREQVGNESRASRRGEVVTSCRIRKPEATRLGPSACMSSMASTGRWKSSGS
jgi:hypothetical protein